MNPPLKVAARPRRRAGTDDRLGAAVAARPRVLGAGPELEPEQVLVHRHDAGHVRGVHACRAAGRWRRWRACCTSKRPATGPRRAAACPPGRPAGPARRMPARRRAPGCRPAGPRPGAARRRAGRRCSGRPARRTAFRRPSAADRSAIPRMSPAGRGHDRGPIPRAARPELPPPGVVRAYPIDHENQAKISTNTAAVIRNPRRFSSRRRGRPGPGGPGGAPSGPAATSAGAPESAWSSLRIRTRLDVPESGMHVLPAARMPGRPASAWISYRSAGARTTVRKRPHGMEHTAQNRRSVMPFSNITMR